VWRGAEPSAKEGCWGWEARPSGVTRATAVSAHLVLCEDGGAHLYEALDRSRAAVGRRFVQRSVPLRGRDVQVACARVES